MANINLNNITFRLSAMLPSQVPPQKLPEIVFSGRSNVGKSSLINTLVNNRSVARVSNKPGKTSAINFFNVDGKLTFVDLPGYGYAKVSGAEKMRWAELVEGYLSSGRSFSAVIQLIDIRHAPTQDDVHMVDFLRAFCIPFIIAATKADKISKTQAAQNLKALRESFTLDTAVPIVAFSSENKTGRDELLSLIYKQTNLR